MLVIYHLLLLHMQSNYNPATLDALRDSQLDYICLIHIYSTLYT